MVAVVVISLVTACADPSSSSIGPAGSGESAAPSPTSRDVEDCPVTVPPQPGFVPPEPYPSEPSTDGAWYGSAELWTIVDSSGAVWTGLPVGKGPHAIGDKTLWFSEKFSTAKGEDFSGNADITITAVHRGGSGRKVIEEGGVPSFNRYIKNFMLVGLGVPEPGCWEVTASYQGAELSYVMLVKD
jgi:hypothetical protein